MAKRVVGFSLLLAVGYTALVALNPQVRRWATRQDGPTPFHFVNQMLALPAQLFGKTENVVATNDARARVLNPVISSGAKTGTAVAGKPVDDSRGPAVATPDMSGARTVAAAAGEPLAGALASREALPAGVVNDTSEAGAAVQPDPAYGVAPEFPPAPGPAELKLPGGVVVANRSPEGAPPASRAFMYWVASLTVSGVSNSSPARFLMNGRVVREGDEANRPLGVTLNHVDAATRLIYFQDRGGAVVTRSY